MLILWGVFYLSTEVLKSTLWMQGKASLCDSEQGLMGTRSSREFLNFLYI